MDKNIEKLIKLIAFPKENLDIYEKWKHEKRIENCKKYPYSNNVAKIPSETKQRLHAREKTDGVIKGTYLKAAVSSPEAWYRLVLPELSRQSGQFEQVLVNYLTKQTNLTIENLPNSGKNSLFLKDGKIVKKSETNLTFQQSNKSIDLKSTGINKEDLIFVAKRTTGRGGAQDNQFADAKKFLYQQTPESKVLLFLVLDGDYYEKIINGKNLITILRDEIKTLGLEKNTFVGNYKEIENKLNSLFPLPKTS